MPDQPDQARRLSRNRVNAVTTTVGLSGVAGAFALAFVLPGSTHSTTSGATNDTTSTTQSTTGSTNSGSTTTTSPTEAPQSTSQAPQATSGGS